MPLGRPASVVGRPDLEVSPPSCRRLSPRLWAGRRDQLPVYKPRRPRESPLFRLVGFPASPPTWASPSRLVTRSASRTPAAYLVRNPLSLKKLVYLDGQQAVLYRLQNAQITTNAIANGRPRTLTIPTNSSHVTLGLAWLRHAALLVASRPCRYGVATRHSEQHSISSRWWSRLALGRLFSGFRSGVFPVNPT